MKPLETFHGVGLFVPGHRHPKFHRDTGASLWLARAGLVHVRCTRVPDPRYWPGAHGETYDLASTLEAVDGSLTRLGLESSSVEKNSDGGSVWGGTDVWTFGRNEMEHPAAVLRYKDPTSSCVWFLCRKYTFFGLEGWKSRSAGAVGSWSSGDRPVCSSDCSSVRWSNSGRTLGTPPCRTSRGIDLYYIHRCPGLQS